MVAGAPLSQASEAAEGQWLLPAHEVGEQVVAANNRAWRSGFDLEVTEAAVLVRVHIHLLPGEDVGRARLDRLAEDWEPQAESLWSDRYGVRIGPDRTLPIRLDVRFRGPGIHHRIIVQNGVARADQLHWGTRSTGQTVAHEIGHMLGAFDEYPGGGTNPAGAVIDESSIMWSQPTRGLSRARHYESVRKALIGAWGRTDLELVALPSTGG
jgi:hypothetical protein